MTDLIERQARAEEAERLLREPMLNEAFEAFEQALLNRALEAPARDDDARRRCLDAVMTLRRVRGHLRSVINDGKAAAYNAANDIANGGKRTWF